MLQGILSMKETLTHRLFYSALSFNIYCLNENCYQMIVQVMMILMMLERLFVNKLAPPRNIWKLLVTIYSVMQSDMMREKGELQRWWIRL